MKPTYYFTVPATDEGLSVTATNVGSRPIHIEHLGFMIKDKTIQNLDTISKSQITLTVSESTTQYFENTAFRSRVKALSQGKNVLIYAYAKDSEGTTYKVPFIRAKEFLNQRGKVI